MKVMLEGVAETMLIPLWAKAAETNRPDPIIRDLKACQIVTGIDYDFSRFNKSRLTQVGVSIRSMILDRAVTGFLDDNAGAVIVNLGAGLDTRFDRIDTRGIHRWYDIDLPEAIELRRRFFHENDRTRCIPKSIFDFSWMDDVRRDGRPLLFIAEGLLMYFPEEKVKLLFRELATRFPASEIVFEMLAPFLKGRAGSHDAMKNLRSDVHFLWALRNSADMEAWHDGIGFLGEWNYYDYHQSRWGWFGRLARLPLIRPMLSNRIVHLRIG